MKAKFFTLLILVFSFCVDVMATALKNKTIMVTASTGALGSAVASSLAAEGYHLIITGRDEKKLNNLKNILNDKNKEIQVQTALIDFSNMETIEKAKTKFSNVFLDGIVLIGPRLGPRPDLSTEGIPSKEEWSKVFSETFIAPLDVIRAFSATLKDKSSIVVMAGTTSKNYFPQYPNKNVVRLAWIGEIKNLTHYFGKRRIRVNAVSPGPILTPYYKEKLQEEAIKNKISFEEQLTKKADSIPLKTYGETDDVSNSILFLISDQSKHINGSNIVLDGGETTAY